jgi:hypothetical protein
LSDPIAVADDPFSMILVCTPLLPHSFLAFLLAALDTDDFSIDYFVPWFQLKLLRRSNCVTVADNSPVVRFILAVAVKTATLESDVLPKVINFEQASFA